MAKNTNKGGGNPSESDKETDEILDEMEAEGIKTTEDDEEEEDEEEQEDDDEEDEDEEDSDEDDDEDDDDEDEEEDEDDEEEEDSDDEDDEEDTDDDEDDDEDDEEEGANRNRPARLVPLWQHKKELKQQEKRLRKELSGAARSADASGDEIDEDSDEVKDIVSKYKLPPEVGPKFVADLINIATRRASKTVSTADIEKLKKQVNDQEEERLFGREMAKTEKSIRKLFPDARPREIARVKDRLKRLAYTTKYQRYSLSDILTLNKDSLAPKGKKAAGEKGGTRGAGKIKTSKRYNLNDPDSIPWADLSDAEFDEVSEALEKNAGSKFKIHKRRG